jgi:hypothetical protein
MYIYVLACIYRLVEIWYMDSRLELDVYILIVWRLCARCMITLLMNYYAIFRLILWKYITLVTLDKALVIRSSDSDTLLITTVQRLIWRWWRAHHCRINGDELFITTGLNAELIVMRSSSPPKHTSDRRWWRAHHCRIIYMPDQRWWIPQRHRIIHRIDRSPSVLNQWW